MKPEKHPLFSNGKDGTLIRNYYCSDCHCGPYLLEDVRKQIIVEIGGERQRFYYCRKCYNIKFSPKVPVVLSEEDKSREEYILSGKALEDLLTDSTLLRDPPKAVYINLGIKPIGKDDKITAVVVEKGIAVKDTKDEPPKVKPIRAPKVEKIKEQVKEPVNVPAVAEQPKDIPNLEALSGKQIIDLVKERTGQTITISVKSKQSIIKHALKLLGAPEKPEQKPTVVVEEVKEFTSAVVEGVEKEVAVNDPVSTSEVNLESLSGRQIIDLVKEKTGQIITISTKSKKSIISAAIKCLGLENVPDKTVTIRKEVKDPLNNLEALSGKQIVELVKEKTGHFITTSTKSKKLIIKQALKLLSDSGSCMPGSN